MKNVRVIVLAEEGHHLRVLTEAVDPLHRLEEMRPRRVMEGEDERFPTGAGGAGMCARDVELARFDRPGGSSERLMNRRRERHEHCTGEAHRRPRDARLGVRAERTFERA